MKAARRIY